MTDNSLRQLILLELNEVNFDIVSQYLEKDSNRFPSLKKLLSGPRILTSSEKQYEDLEPWIQWASVHTTKTYAEHRIFRLGDIINYDNPQIFEKVEAAGYKVGAISAMNTDNRLKNPSYFVPDPWTQTLADSSWWSKSIGEAVSQAVNDNSQSRITVKSAIQLTLGLIRFARFTNYHRYISLILASIKKPWVKSLVLDLFLHDMHWTLFKNKKPYFSTLFLNSAAHIQHHYLFNAEPVRSSISRKNPDWYLSQFDDPLADVLELFDLIVGEYLSCSNTEIIFATGLSQKPYDNINFYYRLKNHADFLVQLGIKNCQVFPRMTRDFLIEFENDKEALTAQNLLSLIQVGPEKISLFGEIDNRGNSLFVTLTYPHEIKSTTFYNLGNKSLPLKNEVSFVALKNGMHQEKGFAFFTPGVASLAPSDGSHVSSLGKTILDYFKIKP